MTNFEILKTREEGGVLFATIDCPPINLFGPTFVRDLAGLIDLVKDNDALKVVVFKSADPEYFIAHVNMATRAEMMADLVRLFSQPKAATLLYRLAEARVVTIAQIAGRTRGIGSEFALACDMRFASRERAILSQPEVGVGLIPGAGGIGNLVRLMGRGRALEAALGGEDFSADLAERYGWINRALPDSELDGFVSDFARRIASFPKAALMTIKDRSNLIGFASLEELEKDNEIFSQTAGTPETQRRVKMLFEQGMQQRSEVELNFGRAIAELG